MAAPRCDSNTSPDQNGDFVVEDVLSRCSVGSVNPEFRHLLTVLESHFVHSHGIDAVVELRLCGTCSKSISKSASEVTDLSNVDGDIGIKGARRDGEWMPLLARYGRNIEEQPLSRLVFH